MYHIWHEKALSNKQYIKSRAVSAYLYRPTGEINGSAARHFYFKLQFKANSG